MVYIDKNLFDIYFSDLNVPIAYLILSIAVFIICKYKKYPLIYTLSLWFFSGFGIAFLFDTIYDYQIKIFILHNISLTEGLLFLLFPLPTYVFIVYIFKFGKPKYLYLILEIIIIQIFLTYISETITHISYDYFIRYCYVLSFIGVLTTLNKYEKINKKKVI